MAQNEAHQDSFVDVVVVDDQARQALWKDVLPRCTVLAPDSTNLLEKPAWNRARSVVLNANLRADSPTWTCNPTARRSRRHGIDLAWRLRQNLRNHTFPILFVSFEDEFRVRKQPSYANILLKQPWAHKWLRLPVNAALIRQEIGEAVESFPPSGLRRANAYWRWALDIAHEGLNRDAPLWGHNTDQWSDSEVVCFHDGFETVVHYFVEAVKALGGHLDWGEDTVIRRCTKTKETCWHLWVSKAASYGQIHPLFMSALFPEAASRSVESGLLRRGVRLKAPIQTERLQSHISLINALVTLSHQNKRS